MQSVSTSIQNVVKELFGQDVAVVLTRPDEQFGDYSTNVALQLAGKLGLSPRAVAEQIVDALHTALGEGVSDITVAGPGFINLTLSDVELLGQAAAAPHEKPDTYQDKIVVTEYSDPNPFKVLHAGHLYTTVVGDVISRLISVAGGRVHRVNFGGDVGLHVGRTMWAIIDGDEQRALAEVNALAEKPLHDRAVWMAERYVKGNNAYEDDESAKAEIIELNKKVYQLHDADDHESEFAKIYWLCRTWAYDYFDAFYKELGVTPFEKYYPESLTAPVGLATVKEQLAAGVYKESNDAVVFEGEPYGLHTRVFINSQGIPTYEAKDVGLIMLKWQDYHFDQSVIITGSEQQEYMAVVLKSIEQFSPELARATTHLTHGLVKLEGGVKMSSRKGNILQANDILQAADAAVAENSGEPNKQTAYAAVKYAFLKQRIGGDIIYNPRESVALEGNSGPYVQYAHARARSILAKVTPGEVELVDLQPLERSLARKISEYPEAVEKSVAELMPHHVCTYLYELAQTFNRFYEHSRVVGDEREALRTQLVVLYADVLKDGLELLGLGAPERL
jgi:arginyl-tRNA synthetase